MSDSENTTFDQGHPNAEKYIVKLDERTKNRMKTLYKTGANTGISLIANSAAYTEDIMKYKVLSSTKFSEYTNNKKKIGLKMNDNEFKIMLSRYLEDDVFVKQEKEEEYLASYYQKIHQKNNKPEPHSEHLKLMYSKVFPKKTSDDRSEIDLENNSMDQSSENTSHPILITETHTAEKPKESPKNVKQEIKTAILMKGDQDKQEMYFNMLKMMGHIEMKEKESGICLKNTAKLIKATNDKINKKLGICTQETNALYAKSELFKRKLSGIKSQPMSPSGHRKNTSKLNIIPHKKLKSHLKPGETIEWKSTADLIEQSKSTKATLLKLKNKLETVVKQTEEKIKNTKIPKSPRHLNSTIKKPHLYKSQSNCFTLSKCITPSTDKSAGVFNYCTNQKMKSLLHTMDENNVIIRKTKNYQAVPPRIIDHSLSIGSPVSTRSSIFNNPSCLPKHEPIYKFDPHPPGMEILKNSFFATQSRKSSLSSTKKAAITKKIIIPKVHMSRPFSATTQSSQQTYDFSLTGQKLITKPI